MKIVVGISITLLLTLALWGFIYKTYPMYLDNDAIAKAAGGGLTPELEVKVRAGFLKSSLVVYVPWGMLVGLIGAMAGGIGGSKFYIRAIIGLAFGAVVGVVTNYFADHYANSWSLEGDAIQYWLIRIAGIHCLLPVVAAVVANVGHPVSEIATRLVKSVFALFLAAITCSFLMGLVTPIEQSHWNFVRFPSNSFCLLFSINVLIFLALAFPHSPKKGVATKSENNSKNE
jgi:hypothetical protein